MIIRYFVLKVWKNLRLERRKRCSDSEKLKEPGPVSEMLGVELDLTESKNGCVALCNKRDRVDDISAELVIKS